MARSSGKCTMYLVSLQGHGTSAWPSSSGAPRECIAGTNGRSDPMASRIALPMRAMTRIETTTYSESVSSTPNIGFSASTGPMQNGMTYMVRPRIEPRYSPVMTAFISSGAIQLLVGPASASSTEQMKVRSSTRATSPGSEAHQTELGVRPRRVRGRVGRPRVGRVDRADRRAVLDARDVAGVRGAPEGVGLPLQAREGAGVDQPLGEPLPLLVAAVDPHHPVRLRELRHLPHPGQQAGGGGGGGGGTGGGPGGAAARLARGE